MPIPTAMNRLGLWGETIITITPVWNKYGVFICKSGASSAGAVSSAMSMSNTVLTYYGNRAMAIFGRGTANSGIINSACSAVVSSGGILNSPEVNANGMVYVYSKGTVNGGEFKSASYLYVYSGASASNVSVSAANFTVNAGANIARVSMASCSITILPDTTANSITIGPSARVIVSGASASANGLVCTIYGTLHCLSGATVTNVSASGGNVSIFASASGMNVSSATVSTTSGTKIEDLNLDSGAYVTFNVYGYDEDTKITGSNASGSFYLSNGTAYNMTIPPNNYCTATYGARLHNISAGSAGCLYLQFGASASGVTMVSDCAVSAESAVVLENLLMSGDGGRAYFSDYSIPRNISISGNSNSIYINYLVSASGITATGNSNSVCILPGGTAANVSMTGSDNYVSVVSGAASDVTISGGYISMSGGKVCNATVQSGGIGLRFSASASIVTVKQGAYINFPSSASNYADSVTVESGGRISCHDARGTATNLDLREGAFVNYPNNLFDYLTVTLASNNAVVTFSGTDRSLEEGGYVQGASCQSGGTLGSCMVQYILSGGTAASVTLTSAAQQRNRGGRVESCFLSFDAYQSNVNVSAEAISTTIGSGGIQYNANSATAAWTEIQAGGSQVNAGGATVSRTLVYGAQINNSTGGGVQAFYNTIYDGGKVYASASCEVSSTMMSGGSMYVNYGGVAYHTIMGGTSAGLYIDNGTAYHTTAIGEGARIIVAYNSAILSGVEFSANGTIYCSSGTPTITDVTVCSGASVYTYGQKIESVTVLSGGTFEFSYNRAFNAGISSGGYIILSGGGGSGIYIFAGGTLAVTSASAFAVTSEAGASVISGPGAYIEYTT